MDESSDTSEPTRDGRWPRWVYDGGHEPDYRFSFANERTFLAWIRTALALIAAGVAIDVVDLDISQTAQHLLTALMVLLGLVCACLAWIRWARAEHAMRRSGPLPSFAVSAPIAGTVVVIAIALTALAL